jgi:hypothetical protein
VENTASIPHTQYLFWGIRLVCPLATPKFP